MNRLFVTSVLAFGFGFAAMPASAVVYCKTVGVPKGCVARPVAAPVSALRAWGCTRRWRRCTRRGRAGPRYQPTRSRWECWRGRG